MLFAQLLKSFAIVIRAGRRPCDNRSGKPSIRKFADQHSVGGGVVSATDRSSVKKRRHELTRER